MQQMIQDLKMDSQRWKQEDQRQETGRGGSPYSRETKVLRPDASLVAYSESRTHAARQHWGPSESFSQGREREREREPARASPYASNENYTTTPSSYAGSVHGHPAVSHSAYPVQQPTYATAPRTQPDPYAAYAQTGREHPTYASQQYAGYSQSPAGYPQSTAPDPYRQQPPPPTHGYAAPRYFGYYDDQFLVYH